MRKIKKTVQLFVANDGEEFDDEYQCKHHQIYNYQERLNVKVLTEGTTILFILRCMEDYNKFVEGLILEERILNMNCVHMFEKELKFPNKFVAFIQNDKEYAGIYYFETKKDCLLKSFEEQINKFDQK